MNKVIVYPRAEDSTVDGLVSGVPTVYEFPDVVTEHVVIKNCTFIHCTQESGDISCEPE